MKNTKIYSECSRNDTALADRDGMKANTAVKNRTRDIVFIALFSVLMAICAWISIPTTVPFTMQTFAVFLALNYLGGKKGTIAVIVYLLLGFIGLPVYANFTAGIGVIFGTTGGYMIGWIFSGLIMWLLQKILGKTMWAQALSMLVGLFVCYAMGTAWFMVVYASTVEKIGLWVALGWCVFPFVIPDILKLGLVLFVTKRLECIARVN